MRDDCMTDPLARITARPRELTAQQQTALANIRASEPEWPPAVVGFSGSPLPPRPAIPTGPLTVSDGCQRGERGAPPCVRVARPGWRCGRCGEVTPVVSPVAGPRLLVCEYRGPDAVLCIHLVGGGRS